MAKNLKINIKNTQIANAVKLGKLKAKMAGKKGGSSSEDGNAGKKKSSQSSPKKAAPEVKESPALEEGKPRRVVKAKNRSSFAPTDEQEQVEVAAEEQVLEAEAVESPEVEEAIAEQEAPVVEAKVEEEAPSAPAEEVAQVEEAPVEEAPQEEAPVQEVAEVPEEPPVVESVEEKEESSPQASEESAAMPEALVEAPPSKPEKVEAKAPIKKVKEDARPKKTERPNESPRAARDAGKSPRKAAPKAPPKPAGSKIRLGPTGRHIDDILEPARRVKREAEEARKKAEEERKAAEQQRRQSGHDGGDRRGGPPRHGGGGGGRASIRDAMDDKSNDSAGNRGAGGGGGPRRSPRVKEFRDVKPQKRSTLSPYDRGKRGAHGTDEGGQWRRRRGHKQSHSKQQEQPADRPKTLSVRLPITVKELAGEMKLKAGEVIAQLMKYGAMLTLNDVLDDETTVQLLGTDFDCEITIDTSEEERIRITDKSIAEEIEAANADILETRPCVVAFMGHVDHGKTSLIDYIRKSSIATGEAGAITQHIGAFSCDTARGKVTVLDTPGHEAFSAMRARGANVTDIVVLVIAGDEGIRQQTVEAIQHAKAAGVTIVVALNKCDKPNFNAENVYRQLADNELLPEAWGGQTITVNCSAVSGEGVDDLLEMLALQSEVMELRANPEARARGSVLEAERHKGLGLVATVLVQNGTLQLGDALVFGTSWGRVKTIANDQGKRVKTAGPSIPVKITGLSDLPDAGQEFIAVESEKEARSIAEARNEEAKSKNLNLARRPTMENLFQKATEDSGKKNLNIVLRADVHGSLEAMRSALERVTSDKVEVTIIFTGVGEVSEADVQLAAASQAIIFGFHTQVESRAQPLAKQLEVPIYTYDVIYHAVDDLKVRMSETLDKVPEEVDKGVAEVRAVFKSSHLGRIAGCMITEGTISRNHRVRIVRKGDVVWTGPIASIRRDKDDVKEINKGFECGIVLEGTNNLEEDDLLQAYEIVYRVQEL